jgi:hypothetical protein
MSGAKISPALVGADDDAAWQSVPQRDGAAGRAVSLLLKPRVLGGPVKLWLALPHAVAETLRWSNGTPLGLAEGTRKWAEWLRLVAVPPVEGSVLKAWGRSNTQKKALHCMLRPPPSLAGLEAPRAECEHLVQGYALLVRIPWDLTAARAELAEQVAA